MVLRKKTWKRDITQVMSRIFYRNLIRVHTKISKRLTNNRHSVSFLVNGNNMKFRYFFSVNYPNFMII